MATRRDFLHRGAYLTALGLFAAPFPSAHARKAAPDVGEAAPGLAPPPDLFDAQALDLDFWLKPRILSVTRPASGERARVLYWKDGDIIDSAYQELCHLMR